MSVTVEEIREEQLRLRIECAKRKRTRAWEDLQRLMAKWYDGLDLTSAEGKRIKECRRQMAEANAVINEGEPDAG